jgi:hypothetical protein
MPSPGMLRRVALVRTDVPEELSASIIMVTRIGELGTLAVTSNRVISTLMMEALSTSETSILTRATRRNIPENGILHTSYSSPQIHDQHPWFCGALYFTCRSTAVNDVCRQQMAASYCHFGFEMVRALKSHAKCWRQTIGQLDQGFPWFCLVPEQMLSWYPNSTLLCMLHMQPSQ